MDPEEQRLKDELEKLDNPEGKPVEKEEEGKPVEKEEESSKKFVEKDGDLYLLDESGGEGTEAEPEEGKTAKESQLESGEREVSYEGTPYEGKSKDEIVDMHRNAEKKINEQGEELGVFRENASMEDISEEEAFEKLSGGDIELMLAEEKTKLDDLDPYDTESVDMQRENISQLESDLIRKRTQEAINERYNSRDNEVFVGKQKEAFADEGIELTDEEFGRVAESSKYYHEDGLLTERSFHKGLIDEFGVEKVTKFLTMKAEEKARDDIHVATTKTTEKVDVRGSGKGAKLVKIDDMDSRERRKLLKGLSSAELEDLYARMNQ